MDTPGFDDTDLDDEDIVTELADWLEKSYRKGQRLSGLLYLHRIIDNREKGSSLRNLKMFKKLCGEQNFPNVVLGITWWDQEDAEIAASREKILRETPEFWGDMVARGSRMVRIPRDRKGCLDLLLDIAQNSTTTLQIQEEMVNQQKSTKETSAMEEMENYSQIRAIRDSEALERAAQLRLYEERLRKLERLEREAEKGAVEQREMFEAVQAKQNAEAEALAKKKEQEQIEEEQRIQRQKRQKEELDRQGQELERKQQEVRKEKVRVRKANTERLRKAEKINQTTYSSSRITSRYQEAIYSPHNTAQKAKMSSTTTSYPDNKWYSFLLPINESQTPVAIYDAPLRRPLFHHAKAGNEETLSARRYSVASTGSERRRSSVASVASALNPFSRKSY